MRDDIIKELDEALAESYDEPQNILIAGRTGIGKSTLVKEWFKMHPDVNAYYFLANTRPYAFNKVVNMDGSETKLDFDGYFDTIEVDNFNSDERVLVIDHFDLTHMDARKHLMNLVKNREAVYNLDGDIKHLDNLKMVIAITFPIGESHFNYDPLRSEDVEAFNRVIEW